MPITVAAHKLAYSPVPKAGCSTVKRVLAHVDPDVDLPPKAEWNVDTWHILYPTVRYKPQRWEKVGDHFKFTVVRDPVKRLLSVYTNRVMQIGDLRHSKRLKKEEFSHISRTPDPDAFFANLDTYIQVASSIKHHVLPTEVFVGPDLSAYDRVYKTDEMGAMVEEIGARTGHSIDIARENSSAMKLTLDDLAPSTIDAIRPRLEEEYAFLKGLFDNPLT